MAGVGEAASILALCLFAFDVSKTAYESVESFKSQRQTVREIQGERGSLTTVLQAICHQIEDSPNQQKFESLRKPVECCTTICEEMQVMLNECTKHTKDSRDSVRDWPKMQYRGGSFDNMKQRLAAYKSTLSITFDSIDLQNQNVTQEALSALKASIEDTKDDLRDQLSDIRDSIDGASASLQKQLQADQTRLQDCLNRLTQAESTANTTRPQINISRNKAGPGARAIFGTDNINPTFDLTASDNDAQAGTITSSGVYSPETTQVLLKGTSTADIMAILQAPQTRPASATTIELLQSVLASRLGSQGTPGAVEDSSRTQGQNLIESDGGQKLEDLVNDPVRGSRVQDHST